MPAAEVDVNTELVASLLAEQHPDLADLLLVELANGWDNVIFRLGDELTVRVPRRHAAAVLIEHEQAVLPGFAARLPIPIPATVRIGRPGCGYPWSWSVNPWFEGEVAALSSFIDPARQAHLLGEFLAALHVDAPIDAPLNPFRGRFIGNNTAVFVERVEQLRGTGVIDVDAAISWWHHLVDVEPWGGSARWIHGDLHGANMLVADGAISAVIDFGDVCAGDPATDLSVAWALFDAGDRAVLRAAAGGADEAVDDATWQRAQAWALHFAVMYLLHSADNPLLGQMGRALVAVLLDTPRRE